MRKPHLDAMNAPPPNREMKRRKQEAGLDEALEQTFPASDPFSVGQFTGTEPPSRPADRKAPRIEPQAAEVRDHPKVAS